MRAWVGSGAESSFQLAELPMPSAGAGELLIKVRAAGLNRVDQNPKTSHFSHTEPAPAPIPGLEAAGEVVAIGDAVAGFRIGDRVMAMVQGGCAEYVRVKAAIALRVPFGMAWSTAGAIPVSYLTAHDALVTRGRLSAGGSVLIHAVTSGVGIAAVQLARLRKASLIAGSSRSRAKLDSLADIGLSLPLADPSAGFSEIVLAKTAGHGVNVVVDNIGGKFLNETLRATSLGGRVIDVGRLGGVESMIDLNLLALRRISLIGVTFRTRTLEGHAAVVQAFLLDHGEDLERGRLAPLIAQVLPFDRLPDAIAKAKQATQLGKFVLEL